MNIHIAFIIFFLAMFCLPAVVNGLPGVKLSKVFLYGIFLVLCMYSGRFCCKRWLVLNEFKKFIVYSCISVALFFITGVIGLMLLTRNGTTAILFTVLFVVLLFFSLGLFFSITRSTILRQLHEGRIMQEQRESELQLLKSQLSPHFLFNVLNNLYGLSLKHDDKVSPMLLKLSGLLRYSLYDTNENFVPLQNELSCIENYMELEKMRIGERLLLDADISKQNIDEVVIAPMLLMVFVENAFKHSKNTYQKNITVKIHFRFADDLMELVVRNSISGEAKTPNAMDNSGIGLSVTKKRLELLYQDKYALQILNEEGFYEVILKIKTK